MEACKEKVLSVATLFFDDKLRSDDVAEFLQATSRVESILNQIIAQKFYTQFDDSSISLKIFTRSLDSLAAILNELHETLVELQKSGRLAKFLATPNSRRTIEQLNSALLVEAGLLQEKNQYLGKELERRPKSGQASDIIVKKEEPTVTVEIADLDGQRFWIEHFGKEMLAEAEKFLKILGTTLNQQMPPELKKILKHILDNSNTGFISTYKFSEFLKGFGPFRSCVDNVTKITKNKWFHGFLTIEEAKRFLWGQVVGTFLMRFSSTRPGSFALAFTAAPHSVTHVMIRTTPEGFTISEEGEEKLFKSVDLIVNYYNSVLKIPFDSTLPEEEWFYGDLGGPEAEELLRGKKAGTFLIRFSSQLGSLAGSYVNVDGSVGKCLIATSPAYYIADEEGAKLGSFPTMTQLVKTLSTVFQFPCEKTENKVNEGFRAKIAKEISDTETSYVKSLGTVFRNFLENNSNSPKPALTKEESDNIFSVLPNLLEIHTEFQKELANVVSTWSNESKLGPIFLAYVGKMLPYSEYTNNYTRAMETWTQVLTKPAVKKWYETQIALCDQTNITSYLIQPIQRIPRYILLLSDLLKHTSSSHHDYEDINSALECVKELAGNINESKREFDSRAKIVQIQSNLIGDYDIKFASRTFMKEGPLLEKSGKKTRERYFFLLSKILIHAKKEKSSKFRYKEATDIDGANVFEISDPKGIFNLNFQLEFSI
eukprot:TRINITY_DN5265_c0_g1_i3.p1 TRINITY_DN5265_c0_g1~~TRINITY_DN5265_c0_g1_i3.p1  ORF type:complete len:712 (-),score=239.28 TRINITY_DN5265_c0_g1_i3:707-2842(-)